MHHSLEIKDGFKMQDKPGGNVVIKEPEVKEYEVINELFKNGRNYKRGEKIMLVEASAKNFIKSGDIK